MAPPPHLPTRPREIKPGPPSDRYWRLPNYAISRSVTEIREHLKSHNYPHNGPASNFPYLLHCIARSLPGYEKCKIAELRLFARQRGLVNASNANRKQLAAALRAADENPRFDHFFALPPELRLMTYQFYCVDFADEPLAIPTYPPLARANRQLLTEMLPVFYSECTFSVGLTTEGYSHSTIPHVLRMQRDTTLFFKSLSPQHLAFIQNLEVTFESRHLRRRVETFRLRVTMPGPKKLGTARVSVHRLWEECTADGLLHPWRSEHIGTEKLGELEEMVQGFLKELEQRELDEVRLVIADVYRLRTMLEAFFEKH